MSPALAWGLLGVAVFSLAVWRSERDADRDERGQRGGAKGRGARNNDIRWTRHHPNGNGKRD